MAMPSPDLIQDITTRFILTAPAEQLMYFESVMFLVEQAHWYYEDYVRENDASLRGLSLRDFARQVFTHCPELARHAGDVDEIMEHFKAFKKNVPVMGAILLDKSLSRVLLVKGWRNSACWTFPRGKIHRNESDAQCAVREVLEETGYDIEALVDDAEFIELTLDGKRNKLFLVAGLDPDSAQFAPKCKGEIGGYAWHRVADLPASREQGAQTFLSEDGTRHRFYAVWPYLKPLRRWIRKRQSAAPEWDMPATPAAAAAAAAAAAPGFYAHEQQPQQQQPQPQQQQQQPQHGEGEAQVLHAPYYPQHVQQLLQQQPPPQVSPEQQRQAAAAVQRQLNELLASSAKKAASKRAAAEAATAAAPGGGGASLASLFNAAAAESSGGGGGGCSYRPFRFDRRAVLAALGGP